MSDRIIYDGDAGTRFTNNTGRVLYQFIASLQNTCGLCLQYHLKISAAWPIPLHYGCRCIQRMVKPDAQAQHEFVNYRELLDGFDESQKAAAIGASNYRLLKTGLAKWDDIVTPNRVRDFREVVARNNLTVKQMTDHGVKKYQADKAYSAVHTAEHQAVAAHRAKLLQQLTGAGLSQETLVNELASRLAARVTVAAGPTGPYTEGPAWSGGPLPGTGPNGAAVLGGFIGGWKPSAKRAMILKAEAKRQAEQRTAAAVQTSTTTPTFETHEDVHAWATSAFPNAKINLEGIPVESWQVIAKEIDHLISKWPDMAARLREFGSMPAGAPDDVIASAVMAGSKSIQFNPTRWKDLAALTKSLEHDVKARWNPQGTAHAGASYYVTHEFGHLLHGYLKDVDPSKRAALDLLMGERIDPRFDYVKFEPKTAKTISKYAGTSYSEAFAEAFAAARWNTNPRNTIVQGFQRNLRELRP